VQCLHEIQTAYDSLLSDCQKYLYDAFGVRSRIGMPDYYRWRSRSGCYFCFLQRKYEWVMLAQEHPDLFAKAIEYEQNHQDGRTYTWTQGETLLELLGRKEQIVAEHQRAIDRQLLSLKNQSLAEVLAAALDEEDDTLPCLACHL
jgi:hypothetical protein